ncbi:hypothetical protein [Mycoplasmopsis gallopavonis]|uniref:Uncharacterized protein n=1 Tax=Mycoplasmopsis gallopavonis TaxID=76629 RepID=A0A449AYU2_9BACT|nr:hypothetical protein [Mycoplasmopsis gallopavonis]RIV16678.1 hypothetical protein D1113_01385 [Mycoplasmopsis gallopavonis]VEU72647.1 Uncharacterised protein [Mycoplasmopsis gallopavonis]
MLKRSEYLKFKSISELWSHEKDTFRPWIIGLIIVFGILIALPIAKLIILGINHSWFLNNLQTTVNGSQAMTSISEVRSLYINTAIGAFLPLLSLVVFLGSLRDSYLKKDFSFISNWPLLVMALLAIFQFYSLISIFIFGRSDLLFSKGTPFLPLNVITIVSSFFTIVSWFFVSREVAAIRNAFIAIHRRQLMEKMEKSFQEMMQNQSFTNPFTGQKSNEFSWSSSFEDQETNKKEAETQTNFNVSPDEEYKTQQIKKLLNLPQDQLYKIAQKLNIVGYEDLTKEELSQKIYYYTEGQNKK